MAALGGLESLLGGLESTTRKILTELLRALVPNLRFGPSDQTKAENFQQYWATSTTANSTATEFSVLHGMGTAPYLAIPMLNLASSGMMTPRLYVTRPADARRCYFRSDDTSVMFRLLLE